MALGFQYTMLFDYFSNITSNTSAPVRIGGWSEGYIANAFDTGTEAQFLALMAARLGMCPRGTSISKYRIQQIIPTGAATLRRTALAAPTTWLSDVPQMALKIQFAQDGTVSAILREFRGLPDVMVTAGEYSPMAAYTTAVNAFLTLLTNGTFKAVRRDKTQTQYSIASINAAGVVTMIDPTPGFAIGTRLQILRTINPLTGRRFGYQAKVIANVDPSHFTISGPRVAAGNFGTLRAAIRYTASFLNPALNDAQAVVRKVGRPLKSYSGRASRRQ